MEESEPSLAFQGLPIAASAHTTTFARLLVRNGGGRVEGIEEGKAREGNAKREKRTPPTLKKVDTGRPTERLDEGKGRKDQWIGRVGGVFSFFLLWWEREA